MKIFYVIFNEKGEIPKETFNQILQNLPNDLAKKHLPEALEELFKVIKNKYNIHILEFGNIKLLGLNICNVTARTNTFSNLKFENQNVYEMNFLQKLDLFNN